MMVLKHFLITNNSNNLSEIRAKVQNDLPKPCGSLATERTLDNNNVIALEQDGKHLAYEFGKFSMAECSCFGLSWFIWEPTKDKNIGWLRLKETSQVLTANPDGQTIAIGNKDYTNMWYLMGSPQATQIRFQKLFNGQQLYLYVSAKGHVGVNANSKTTWKIKHGIF